MTKHLKKDVTERGEKRGGYPIQHFQKKEIYYCSTSKQLRNVKFKMLFNRFKRVLP